MNLFAKPFTHKTQDINDIVVYSDCVNYLTIKPITSWSETLKDKLKKANRL